MSESTVQVGGHQKVQFQSCNETPEKLKEKRTELKTGLDLTLDLTTETNQLGMVKLQVENVELLSDEAHRDGKANRNSKTRLSK